MKYIEKKYQQLIEDIKSAYEDTERAYGDTCDTLEYHIDELKKIIAEKDEEIEKLKGGDQKEADECKRLKEDLAAAHASAEAWETRFYTLVHQYGINLNRPVEKKNVEKAKGQVKKDGRGKYERKTFIVTCGDCGVLFEAKGGNAKYCPDCRKARISARSRAWKLKHRKNK
jgi:hypothetical protein